ncbi:MAG: Release factor glutamine methyltransferase [Phycisphaerales bacterium]|nr:Release factor glutamine methyltransferase [Phycisphaerales bacterium]
MRGALDPDAMIAAASSLRDALARAGFTHRGVQDVLGVSASGFADLSSTPLVLWRTREPNPINTLVRLFIAGADVPARAATEALGPAFDACRRCGVIESANESGQVRAALALLPFEDVVNAADFSLRPTGPVETAADHVMGVGRSSASLGRVALPLVAAAQRRTGAASVLDLGCGGGYLALRASLLGARATGTDINLRAVMLGRFNAVLNDCLAEFRLGSLFEPVATASFDVVISNPPFVISPETGLIFRDGASRLPPGAAGHKRWGDEFCAAIARTGPAHLSEGGTLAMLFNAAGDGPDAWVERVRSWTPPHVQVLAMRTDVQRTDEYASMWIRHTASGRSDWSPGTFARMFDEWMRYYETLGVSHIAYGVLVIRRASPAFFDASHTESRWIDSGAIDLQRHLDGREVLAGLGSDEPERRRAIMALAWRLADDARVVRSTVTGGGVDQHAAMVLGPMDRPVASISIGASDVITRARGVRTLDALVAEAASVTGIDRAVLAQQVAAAAEELIRDGMLVRAP